MKKYKIGLMALSIFIFSGCTAEEAAYFNQSMNNASNQMRQNTYNTQQSTYQVQQLNNQMYQQRQDRQRNIQMQQINNNLNGIRYGY